MTASPTTAVSSPPTAPPRRRRRRVLRVVLGALALVLVLLAVSVGRALVAPGTDSTSARLAEWARGHGLSRVVDLAERISYTPPATGGTPGAGSPLQAQATAPAPKVAAPLAAVAPFAAPPLPGEGRWTVVASVHGRPALQQTFLRPDAVHTSYTAGLAWMDPSLLRFVLHPGTEEPGGKGWTTPPQLAAADRTGLLAAFNGGFRMDAARGGFYADGRTKDALRDGAASLVIDDQGRASVGQWGRDAQLGPHVAAVRQNLDLLVDGGAVVPGLADNSGGRWGRTLGNKLYVFRSGVGQTASGAVVYAAGNGLSAATLAALLQRAGAVRAMELDINPEWTSFVDYPAEHNLLPDMQRSPRRYDTASTRDFVAVYGRP